MVSSSITQCGGGFCSRQCVCIANVPNVPLSFPKRGKLHAQAPHFCFLVVQLLFTKTSRKRHYCTYNFGFPPLVCAAFNSTNERGRLLEPGAVCCIPGICTGTYVLFLRQLRRKPLGWRHSALAQTCGLFCMLVQTIYDSCLVAVSF